MMREDEESDTGRIVATGDWAGWFVSEHDPYEEQTGPFYRRRTTDGRLQCAFRVAKKHLNNSGFVHGGCLMTFADFSLFWIAQEHTHGVTAVTVSFNSEFVNSAREGDLLQANGEVVRAASSLTFVRGLITSADKPVLNFSAIVKKIHQR